jgi:hypothetical protein
MATKEKRRPDVYATDSGGRRHTSDARPVTSQPRAVESETPHAIASRREDVSRVGGSLSLSDRTWSEARRSQKSSLGGRRGTA